MARGIDEEEPGQGDLDAQLLHEAAADLLDDLQGDLCCAYVLGDSPRFPLNDSRASDVVQKKGLAMVYMA